MGCSVTITDSRVVIRKDNFDTAYKALCEINAHDELKSGGILPANIDKPESSKSVGNPNFWFSWMPWNYDEKFDNLQDILWMLGFDVVYNDDGDIVALNYDEKMGDEGEFLGALAPYVDPDSYINWTSEYGDEWSCVFDGTDMIVHE